MQDQRHNDTVGHILFRYNKGLAADHVYTVSPTFLINTRYSYTRYIDGNYPDQDGWDLAGLGFSSTFINQINAVLFQFACNFHTVRDCQSAVGPITGGDAHKQR